MKSQEVQETFLSLLKVEDKIMFGQIARKVKIAKSQVHKVNADNTKVCNLVHC